MTERFGSPEAGAKAEPGPGYLCREREQGTVPGPGLVRVESLTSFHRREPQSHQMRRNFENDPELGSQAAQEECGSIAAARPRTRGSLSREASADQRKLSHNDWSTAEEGFSPCNRFPPLLAAQTWGKQPRGQADAGRE